MKRLTITHMVIVVALASTGAVPASGAARGGGKQMGYCFDAAFHEKTSRLFVASGDKGTHVFGVKDGKLKFVTTVADGGYHRNLKISGDRVYLADADRGLVVFDITAGEPVCTWRQQGAHGMGLDVHGHYVYLAAGGDGLHIFDISTPDAPKLLGTCKTNADAWDVWVSGPYAYVADLQKGVTVVDVSQPAHAKKVSWVTWDENEPMAEIVRGEGPIVCVGAGNHGLVVVDISDPQAPKVVSQYKSGEQGFGEGLCIRDGLVYLANGNEDSRDENGLIIVDARNPHALKVRGKCTFAGWVEGVCLAGGQAFVTNTYTGVRSIDVRDPDHPRLTDSFGPAQAERSNPMLTADMSPQETQAIEEFRRIKARILAGESYEDTSTPLHAALTQFSTWGPGGTRDYFTGLDVFRAPLPPERPEEGSVWPIFAGSGEVEDTFIVAHSKGQWIWLGNMGNPGDWRPAKSWWEERAKEAIERKATSDRPATAGERTKATSEEFLKTEISPQERAAIELIEKTKGEILEGRKFNDLSTVGGAFLTYVSAMRHEDEALLLKVAPIFTDFKMSSGRWSQLLDYLIRPAIVRRIEVESEAPSESDLRSIYTSNSPNRDIDQIWTFGYVEGAWRFLNCTVPTDPWMSIATKCEARTREILQKGVPQQYTDDGQAGISEEIAVVTGLPSTVEIADWDVALETDLPHDRFKVKATCTLRNNGGEPVDHLDFDLLAREKFYGVQVDIAGIARHTGDQQTAAPFQRFIEEPPQDPGEAGTRNYPLVTRVSLSPALQGHQECRLTFDYAVTCPDVGQKHHYNLIWEPQEGRKELCLISDFTWFPDLGTDLQKRMLLSGEKNFFARGSRPSWHVTLTHPAALEGMVIEGELEKSERAGARTVSRWRSITGGRPQLFVGPAERVERKGNGVTVVFLLPKGGYNPEFVDAVGDLVIDAYHAFTDWFGPFDTNEVHIVAPSGIRGGHGAFMGMTAEASYFRMDKSERLTPSGKFFTQTPVHELAHSCWPESYGRGTKFLRESLSNFATWHLARDRYGLNIFNGTLQGLRERAQVDYPLFHATGDEEQFAYEKGPLVLDVLRQEMGDDVFFRALKEYVRRYRNNWVTFIDFVSVCNEVSQRDWMPFFYQWCYAKGCPGYRLVEFESKQGPNGWETAVTIRNTGTGIIRCPLELRMDGAVQEELFAIPGGREKTFLYSTAQKVVDVAIDPRQTVYQEDLTEKRKSPEYLVKSVGYGPASNREIAARYDATWLEQLGDAWLLCKTGFALYDVKRYEEALTVFEKMEEEAVGDQFITSVALIWQGHMLDLLGRRPEAVARYKKVAGMGLDENTMRHDQFGIAYVPSPYARERINTPFIRVENRYGD